MKWKKQFFEIDASFYNTTVYVAVGLTEKEVARKLKIKEDELDLSCFYGEKSIAYGMTTHMPGTGYLVQFKRDIDIPKAQLMGWLAHEMAHVVFMRLLNAGMKLSDDSDEAFTYFLEYLVRKASWRLFS